MPEVPHEKGSNQASSSLTREIRLTVRNYRCFPATRPARFSLRPGFTSFIGVNNAGKSTLLKMLYELRDVFRRTTNGGLMGALLPTNWQGYNSPPEITDPREIIAKLGTGEIQIQVEAQGYGPPPTNPELIATAITLYVRDNAWRAGLVVNGREIELVPSG